VDAPEVTWGDKISGELVSGKHDYKKIHLPPVDSEVPIEVALKAERRKQISEYVKKQPDEASKLLKVWLSEEV
jgi:flagellar biosynthesis/type III secretory pathway M-ring protein FliF/YscJ